MEKIRMNLFLKTYVFKYHFYIPPGSGLCYDFIYGRTSTTHLAMFWVKGELLSSDDYKNLRKT